MSNNQKITLRYKKFIIINQEAIKDLWDQGKLTRTDIAVIVEIANNLAYQSNKLNISQRELGRILGISYIARHIKNLTEANVLKKRGKDLYLNPEIGCNGTTINKDEYDMFNCTMTYADRLGIRLSLEKEDESDICYDQGF